MAGSSDEFVSAESCLLELLEAHAVEIGDRGIVVHSEFDEEFHVQRATSLASALEALLRFAVSTVPDGCEIYLAATRSRSPVAALGAGSLTLRWQVAGTRSRVLPKNVTALRPLPGSAAVHAGSQAARGLERAFVAAGWNLEISTAQADRELWVHATRT